MHMTFHTYRTIKRSLMQTLQVRSGGHQEQHINTLALLICGIVGAQHVQFAQIADHAPLRGRKNESLITRFLRWVKQKTVTPEAVWLPFAKAVLASLAHAPLTIILDGTTVGRGCLVLMASVVYHGCAIPLLWTVVKGKKGHLPQAEHCALIKRLQTLIPETAQVMLLGDGEFDGTQLQAALRTAHWQYVCRTATNITIYAHDRIFPVGALPLKRGEAVALDNVRMTAERYGPVLLLGIWDTDQQAPIYLVTSLCDPETAAEWYRRRFRIERMFAQHKSRGFHLHKSHLRHPERVARLLLATSVAYVWVHEVAMFAQTQGWVAQFHRRDRCDLSLFQIGLRAMHYARREGKRIPMRLRLPADPPPIVPNANEFSVR
jgi:DDE family transposase